MIERKNILIVDADSRFREKILYSLDELNANIIIAKNNEKALNCIERENIDILISLLKGKQIDGMHLLEVASHKYPDVGVILITTQNVMDTDVGVKAMNKYGASYFLTKPINFEQLCAIVRKVIERQRLFSENRQLQYQIDSGVGLKEITGNSTVIRKVRELISQIAPTRATVLIQGERGTGKELAARAIHHRSLRRGSLVTLHCAALAENLLESELFGHERGAFTGAFSPRKGRFEAADGGTLFLDEIGEMSMVTQAKVLRVIQEQEFEKVGSNEPIKVDVRIVAATNKDLLKAVEIGEFRADLYDRLNVVKITMPPLRDRKEDIPALVNEFIQEFSFECHKRIDGITSETMHYIERYDCPGNVRELKNCIEGMVVMCQRKLLEPDLLPDRILSYQPPDDEIAIPSAPTVRFIDSSYLSDNLNVGVGMSMSEIEKEVIKGTLKYTDGDRAKTAKILEISKRTIYRKIKEYEL